MNNTSNDADKTDSLGKVAKALGVNRTYLSDRMHAEVRFHSSWPSLQRIEGQYCVGAYLLTARLSKMCPRPVYEVVSNPTPAQAYAMVDAAAWSVAYLAGTEGDPDRYPILSGLELSYFLRALGDILSVALEAMDRPDGYANDDTAPAPKAAP